MRSFRCPNDGRWAVETQECRSIRIHDIAQLNYEERRRHGERGADHGACHNFATQSPRMTRHHRRQRLDEGGNSAIANAFAGYRRWGESKNWILRLQIFFENKLLISGCTLHIRKFPVIIGAAQSTRHKTIRDMTFWWPVKCDLRSPAPK